MNCGGCKYFEQHKPTRLFPDPPTGGLCYANPPVKEGNDWFRPYVRIMDQQCRFFVSKYDDTACG